AVSRISARSQPCVALETPSDGLFASFRRGGSRRPSCRSGFAGSPSGSLFEAAFRMVRHAPAVASLCETFRGTWRRVGPVKRPFLVALDLTDRRCLVVGRSPEAARRATALLEAGAQVTVVGESPCPELEALAHRGDIELRSEEHTSELQSREKLVCR